MARCELSATQCTWSMSEMHRSSAWLHTVSMAHGAPTPKKNVPLSVSFGWKYHLCLNRIMPFLASWCVYICVYFYEDCTPSLSFPGNARAVLVLQRLQTNGLSDAHYIYIYKYNSVAQRIRGLSINHVMLSSPSDPDDAPEAAAYRMP